MANATKQPRRIAQLAARRTLLLVASCAVLVDPLRCLSLSAHAQQGSPREVAPPPIGALMQSNPELIARVKRAALSVADTERDLPEAAASALVRADYEHLAELFGRHAERDDAGLLVQMWNGHAHQLQGDFARAVAAYENSLQAIERELRSLNEQGAASESIVRQVASNVEELRRIDALRRRQQELKTCWPQIVLLVGLLKIHELDRPEAAVATLSSGLRHSVLENQSLAELAEDAKLRLTGKDPKLAKESWRELRYPIATQRHLAIAHERLGNTAAAVDAWTRVRLSAIAYDVPLARTDAAHLRSQFAELDEASLQPWHRLVLENPGRERRIAERHRDLASGELGELLAQPENPFEIEPLNGVDFADVGPAAPSLVRLADGQLLAAYTAGDWEQSRIMFTASEDGTTWDEPWPFPHNSIFNTLSPSLILDSEGTVWLVCLSKRLDTDRFSSAGYYLWICHSRDGKRWSRLRPILTDESAQYQFTTQLTRSPDGRYWLFYNGYATSAQSPDDLRDLDRLTLPVTDEHFPTNTHATFAADGTCHLVFDDFGRAIYYTRSADLKSWAPLQQLAAREEGSGTSFPRIVVEETKVAVLFDTNGGLWLRRGELGQKQLNLGQPVKCTNQRLRMGGADGLISAGRLYLLVGSDVVAALMTAKLAELWPTGPQHEKSPQVDVMRQGNTAPPITVGPGPTTERYEPALVGRWKVVKFQTGVGPQAVDEETVTEAKITPDTIAFEYKDRADTMRYLVDRSKTPKEIDLILTGPAAVTGNEVYKGIYKLDGDELRICFTKNQAASAARPTTFEAEDRRAGYRIYMLKRQAD